jgi:hypothetical protein
MDLNFITILQTVIVRIKDERIGLMGLDLLSIQQPIAVGIRQKRIRPERSFALVGQSIAVRIPGPRKGSLCLIEGSRLRGAGGGGQIPERDEEKQA